MKTISEKIKGIFAKAGDEAAKVVDESGKETKETKAEDAAPAWATKLQKAVDALMSASPSTGEPSKLTDKFPDKKDDKADDEFPDKKDDKADDADPEKKDDDKQKADDAMESRFSKLEDAISKLCDAAGIEMGDEEEEESEDAEEEEDDDFEETPAGSSMDQAARIEILSPGLKAKGKDAKRLALTKAYDSKDNKAIIDRLNGGKAVDFKKASQKTIDHLFTGASEVISLYRTKDFTKWKQVRDEAGDATSPTGPLTAEQINEKNEKFYKGAH